MVLVVAFADLEGGVEAGLTLAGVVAAGWVLLGREGPVDLGAGVLAADDWLTAFLTTAGSGGDRGRAAVRCDDRMAV